jgi:DNA-binding LytR/AlgR family response regulator
MIMIAVCDDENFIGAELERALIDILSKSDVAYKIDVFFTGEELCRHVEAGAHFDLIFLDIEFAQSEINGVEVGLIIRETHKNNAVFIVYISWEKKYSMQLFDIRPLNFLIKPLEQKKIEQVVKTYLEISGHFSEDFTYKIRQETFKVRTRDIVYLENNDRKVILHLADGSREEFYGSLKEAYEKQLKRFDFLFVHASYVVNYDFVASMKYKQIFLVDKALPLPVSQNNRNEVRERYYAIMEKRRA